MTRTPDPKQDLPAVGELTPAGYAEVGPLLNEVIVRWHDREAEIGDWPSAEAALPSSRPTGWSHTAERLQLINTFQWHEEDRSRDHGVDDTILAAVKRSIDASNRRRVQTVDRLDDLIFSGLRDAGVLRPDSPLNSESPGSIIDRLSVLALKQYHVREALALLPADQKVEHTAMVGRLDTLTEQRTDLGGCLDSLLEGIRAGRIGLKLYRQVKVYRDPDTGGLRADLD